MRNLVSSVAPARRQRVAGARPRPLPAARPQLVIASAVLAVGFASGTGWQWVVAVAAPVVVVGLVQAARSAAELGRQRRVADEWLLWGVTARPSSVLLSWRAAELTSPRVRSLLASGLRRIEGEVCGRTMPGPVPLNKRAIRRHVHLVRALYERLEDRDRAVDPRGMVLVDRLLTEPRSPLYSHTREEVVAEVIGEVLATIDPPVAAAVDRVSLRC